MKKLLLLVAAVITSATMNAQGASQVVNISTAFTNDVIKEADAETTDTYPKFPDGLQVTDDHGCQFVSQAFLEAVGQIGTGIPESYATTGFTTSDGHKYKLQPFDQNNAIMLICGEMTLSGGSVNMGSFITQTKDIEFATAVPANTYNYVGLIIECMTGSQNLEITLNYSDNSTEVLSKRISNWCGTGGDVTAIATQNKRWFNNGNWSHGASSSTNYLYELPLPIAKDLKSVTIKVTGDEESLKVNDGGYWGWTSIAVLGASAWDDGTLGLNDLTVENNETVQGIYTVDGRQVSEAQKGLNVVKMSNGKAVKVIKK